MRKVKVNLTKYVATEAGLRYCPAVITSNGRIKQDIVLVSDKEERHPEGAYYLDWRRNGVRVRLSVGKNGQDALTQRDRRTFELNAAAHGVELASSVVPNGSSPNDGRKPLSVAVADFLEDTKLSKKPKTLAAYKTALNYFTESCPKLYVEDIERRDMLKFAAFLRDEKEQAPRSVHNKFENVMSFLKAQGVRGLVGKNDWPRYTEEEPEVYEQDELDTLFAACDAEERLWFEFFLMTGMREQEVMHVLLVGREPEGEHREGHSQARTVDAEGLQRARDSHSREAGHEPTGMQRPRPTKTCPLVFPTAGCRPKLNFLDDLKAVAERAGSVQRTSGFTSSGRHSQRGTCGRVLICARFSSGSVTPTWRARCAI